MLAMAADNDDTRPPSKGRRRDARAVDRRSSIPTPAEEAEIRAALVNLRQTLRAIGVGLFDAKPSAPLAYALHCDDPDQGGPGWLAPLRRLGQLAPEQARAIIRHGGLGQPFRVMAAHEGTSHAFQHGLWLRACRALLALRSGARPDEADLTPPAEPDQVAYIRRDEKVPRGTVALGFQVYGGRALADLVVDKDPDTGTPVQHLKVRDNIAQLLRLGTITERQAKAAARFRSDFLRAGYDPLRAAPMESGDRSAGGPAAEMDGRLDAQQIVADILDVAGGRGTVVGSLLWHIAGEGRSIAQYSREIAPWGAPGRRQRNDQEKLAKQLAAALEAVAEFYDAIEVMRKQHQQDGGAS